jgi:hypothetical protein
VNREMGLYPAMQAGEEVKYCFSLAFFSAFLGAQPSPLPLPFGFHASDLLNPSPYPRTLYSSRCLSSSGTATPL